MKINEDLMRKAVESLIESDVSVAQVVMYLCASNPDFIDEDGRPVEFICEAARKLNEYMEKNGYYDAD